MSLGHGASIVRDGLMLHLDAANVKSYPGSGTTWNDLSGFGNNGTLINSVPYSTNDNGKFDFDGASDYVDLGLPTNLVGVQVPLTINMWAYKTATTSFNALWGVYESTSGGRLYSLLRVDGGTLRYFTSTSTNSFQSVGSFTIPLNQWFFYGVVVSGTLASPSVKIFLNDQSQSFNLVAMDTPDPTVEFKIGAARNGTNDQNWPGSISSAMWYNRALSDEEIKQNFNALRGRYGI